MARALFSLTVVGPAPERRADDGEHWIVSDAEDRLPVVLIEGATAATPAAAVIPAISTFWATRVIDGDSVRSQGVVKTCTPIFAIPPQPNPSPSWPSTSRR